MPCPCNEEKRVTICSRCEGINTPDLARAFAIEFKVDLEYCDEHKDK